MSSLFMSFCVHVNLILETMVFHRIFLPQEKLCHKFCSFSTPRLLHYLHSAFGVIEMIQINPHLGWTDFILWSNFIQITPDLATHRTVVIPRCRVSLEQKIAHFLTKQQWQKLAFFSAYLNGLFVTAVVFLGLCVLQLNLGRWNVGEEFPDFGPVFQFDVQVSGLKNYKNQTTEGSASTTLTWSSMKVQNCTSVDSMH